MMTMGIFQRQSYAAFMYVCSLLGLTVTADFNELCDYVVMHSFMVFLLGADRENAPTDLTQEYSTLSDQQRVATMYALEIVLQQLDESYYSCLFSLLGVLATVTPQKCDAVVSIARTCIKGRSRSACAVRCLSALQRRKQ